MFFYFSLLNAYIMEALLKQSIQQNVRLDYCKQKYFQKQTWRHHKKSPIHTSICSSWKIYYKIVTFVRWSILVQEYLWYKIFFLLFLLIWWKSIVKDCRIIVAWNFLVTFFLDDPLKIGFWYYYFFNWEYFMLISHEMI